MSGGAAGQDATPDALYAAVRSVVLGELLKEEPLSAHLGIGIGGPADLMIWPEDRSSLIRALQTLRPFRVPVTPLGMGTGVLAREGGVSGVVLRMRRLGRLEMASDGALFAEGGASLAALGRRGLQVGCAQAAYLCAEVGTVGGALAIGASSLSLGLLSWLESIEVCTPSGRVKLEDARGLRTPKACAEKLHDRIILGVTLRLPMAEPNDPGEVEGGKNLGGGMGPIFRPPEHGRRDLPGTAEGLIALGGFAGVRVRGAQILEARPNWIVNVGNARSEDVLTLIRVVRDRVKQEHGVVLEPGIRVIGRSGQAGD